MREIWILAGQSNMEGVGYLDNRVEPPHERVFVFAHGDEWRVAEEPLHWLLEALDPVHWDDTRPDELDAARAQVRRERRSGAGCGLAFGRAVADATGHEIGLVPCAHGGTEMFRWDPALRDDARWSLFGATLRRARAAIASCPGSRLGGILWYQGESDANPRDAAFYEARMHTLIGAFRECLGDPQLPFLLVQLGCCAAYGSDEDMRAWCRIRDIQRTLPASIPNVATVPAIDLSMDDVIHIGTSGLKRLGKRLARVALHARDYPEGATAIDVESVRLESGGLHVCFRGVRGRLHAPDPCGRVPGFAVHAGDVLLPAAYKACLHPENHSDVLVSLAVPLAPDALISYGWGYNPFCQLTDDVDMAVPAFGPLPITRD